MKSRSIPASTVVNHEHCYACHREFAPNTMGGCMVCGADLCMENDCDGKCSCDEQREHTFKTHAYKPHAHAAV